jgi:hypothetical protein
MGNTSVKELFERKAAEGASWREVFSAVNNLVKEYKKRAALV